MSSDEVDKFMDSVSGVAAPASPQHESGYQTGDKRKNSVDDEVDAKQPKLKKDKAPKVQEKKPQENRAIYITNLPRDTTEHELEEEFKRFGIIDRSSDGTPRIKLYYDAEGNFNGEALLVYFKKDSIPNAIQYFHDYWLRPTEQTGPPLSVKEADMSYKRNTDTEKVVAKMTRKDKKAIERNKAEMNRKLAEWSDNEEEVAEAYAPKKNKHAKVVILKHVFKVEELDEDEGAILDIKEDMRTAAEDHGPVTNVTLWDKEEDGIVTIRFREFDHAEKFRAATHGRWYDKRQLEATLAEDRPKFKKSTREEEPEDSD